MRSLLFWSFAGFWKFHLLPCFFPRNQYLEKAWENGCLPLLTLELRKNIFTQFHDICVNHRVQMQLYIENKLAQYSGIIKHCGDIIAIHIIKYFFKGGNIHERIWSIKKKYLLCSSIKSLLTGISWQHQMGVEENQQGKSFGEVTHWEYLNSGRVKMQLIFELGKKKVFK